MRQIAKGEGDRSIWLPFAICLLHCKGIMSTSEPSLDPSHTPEPSSVAAGVATLEETPKAKASFTLKDGLQILGIALLIALFLRGCVLEGFRIPSESMEKSLLKGDFVLVSKLHYGPRLPLTVGVPLTNWYFEDFSLPYLRLPGFTSIRRSDAIVFNYPAEEAPVDRRMHYIKRVVGLPGDSVSIRDKQLYVNGLSMPLAETMQQNWIITMDTGARLPVDSLRILGASEVTMRGRSRANFVATPALAERVASWEGVVDVTPNVQAQDPSFGMRIFPPGSAFGRDHYGPLSIPARGDTITLSSSNWLMYKDLIERYEHHHTRMLPNGTFEIDSVRTTQYVVEQDYYFVLGDNRDSSVDSRVWGFVPMDHVVGKAVFVYFSWDSEQGRVRANRILKSIH